MNLQKLENPQQWTQAAALDPSQVESLASMLSQALHDEPNFAYMVPDEGARRMVFAPFFLSAIRAGQLYGEIQTTENGDGVAVWIRPELDMPLRRMVRMGPIAFNTRFMKLGASIEEVRKRLAPAPHWYLMAFGVEASRPEKSIGEALIEPVLSQADTTRTPCYLETFCENRLAFYKDFGFRIAGAGRISDGGPNFWAMTRPVRKSLG